MKWWKDKKVVLTGAGGFIGKHIFRSLFDAGSEIIAIESNSESLRPLRLYYADTFEGSLHKAPTFCNADLYRDSHKRFINFFHKADVVIHLAALVGGYHYYKHNDGLIAAKNSYIDSQVLKLSILQKVKYFFYASSSHVYPPHFESPLKEKDLLEKPYSLEDYDISYGWVKRIMEKKLEMNVNVFQGISIARLNGIYGPGQPMQIHKSSLIPVMCRRVCEHPVLPVKLMTNGKEVRSYCYIDDALEAIFKMIELSAEKKEVIGPLNIGNNNYYKIKTIVEKIVKISQKENIEIETEKTPGNLERQYCDCSEAYDVLDWKPKTSIDVGLMQSYLDIHERLYK